MFFFHDKHSNEITIPYTSEFLSSSPEVSKKIVPSGWKAGDVIMDLYEVKELLGSGTYGSVYRVYHRNWQMDLAVKSLHHELSERENYKKSFLKECQEWVKLGLHPHIISCHYVRDIGGIPHIFLEYAEGGSLSSIIYGIHDLKEIISLSLQCFTGLSFAHRKGIIHRDIKPANCLIKDGCLKITDFGIACSFSSPSEEFFAAGTPAYMPPEQWISSCGEIGPWSDIYAAAIMIYEMCCKCRPFDRGVENSGVIKLRHISSPPPHPSEFNEKIPSRLSDFILKCLEKSPEDRFTSCDEAIKRLSDIYEELTGEKYTCPVIDEVKLMPDGLNNRAVSLMDLGMEKEALNVWEEALSLDPLHIQSLYNRGLVLWRSGEIDDLQLLEEISSAGDGGSCESFCLSGLVHLERDDPLSALESFKKIPEPYESDIKNSMDYAEKRCKNCSSLIKKVFNNGYQPVERLSLSGDNRWAFGTGMDYLKIHIPSGELSERVRGSGVVSVMTDRYGNICLTSYQNGLMIISDMFTGKEIKTLKAPWTLKLSYMNSDGSLISGIDICNNIYIWHVSTEKMLKKIEGIKEHILSVHITPDNKYLLYGTECGTVAIIDISTFTVIQNFHSEDSVYSICFSYDGKKALLMDYRGNVSFFDVFSGTVLKTFKSVEFFRKTIRRTTPLPVSLNHDGSLAVMVGNSVKLLHTSTGKCLRSFQGHNQKVYSAVMDHDGKLIVSGDEMGQIKVWKISDFNYIAPFRLSKIKSTEEKGEVQIEYDRLLEKAAGAVENKEFREAITLLKRARSLPGYEQSPGGLRLWAHLTGICKKTDLRNVWIEKTFTLPEDIIYGVYIIDNDFMVSASSKNILSLWDVLEGKSIKIFEGDYGEINSAFLNSEMLPAGYRDGKIRLFDRNTGKSVKTFAFHEKRVDFLSMTGDIIVSHSHNDLKIWHRDGTCIKNLRGENLRSLSLTGNMKLLFSHGKNIKICDLKSGKILKILENHSKDVLSLSFAGNTQHVLSGGADSNLILWDIVSGKSLQNINAGEGEINCISMSFDGHFAVAAITHPFDRNKKFLKLFNLSTGELIKTLENSRDYIDIQLSNDGNFLLTADSERSVKLRRLDWELQESDIMEWHEISGSFTGNFIDSYMTDITSMKSDMKEIYFVKFLEQLSPAGYGTVDVDTIRKDFDKVIEERLIYSGFKDKLSGLTVEKDASLIVKYLSEAGISYHNPCDLELWQKLYPYFKKKNLRRTDLTGSFKVPGDMIYTASMSNDGQLALSAGGYVILWHISDGTSLMRSSPYTGAVRSVCLSSDNKLILAGYEDGKIRFWNVSGECLYVLEGHKGRVTSLAITGDLAVSAGIDGTIKLWDINTGRLSETLEGHCDEIWNLLVCEEYIFSGSKDKTVKLWDLSSGKSIRTFEGHDDKIRNISISSDGKFLLSSSMDGVSKLWNKSQEITLPMSDRAFLAGDGMWIFYISGDSVCLYNLSSRKSEKLDIYHKGVNSIQINPSSSFILTSDMTGHIKRWSLDWELEF